MRQFVTKLIMLVFVVIIVMASRYFVLDGGKSITLRYSSSYGAIASALRSAHGNTYQPIQGKDYTISRFVYFDNSQWLIVYTSPVGNFSDPGIIVLQKKGAYYRAMLGPTSDSFTSSELVGLPSNLSKYLGGGSQ
jgi:hypothetical protein